MNNITYFPQNTSFIYLKGYNFDKTRYVFLSTNSIYPFYSLSAINLLKVRGTMLPEFSGVEYDDYVIQNSNEMVINVHGLSATGQYDLIVLNSAGIVKLSDTRYLINANFPTPTPSLTRTPTVTPTKTYTPSVTQTPTQTPTPAVPSACLDSWSLVNFNGTTFRNGDPIPQITDQEEWNTATGPGWCYYDNNSANGTIYGKLYNRYAVADARGLAPEGYHVPSLAEWQDLIICLGGSDAGGGIWPVAGAKMKTTGTIQDNDGLWNSPNVATNESGFSVVPAGCRAGGFINLHSRGSFWVYDSDTCINFNNGASYVYIGGDSTTVGYSVRLKAGNSPTPTATPTPTTTSTPTPSITPTITPTITTTPLGIPISNNYIAINYGNVNPDFGTNVVVVRDNGYDPDIVYYSENVNNNPYRAAYLDANFNASGYWSFILENRISGRSYAWANSSTNFDCIPFSGWYGTSANGLFAGTTNLVLSATSQPATPTPTPTPTITLTPTNTPYLYNRASQVSIQDSYNLLKNISSPAKNYTNFSLLCTLGFNNFCNDWSGARREWNPNFWGYANRNILNFSGVSLNTELNATLITPQHFIGNSHFAPSLSCCFYDHNTGEAVHIKIQDYRNSGIGEDCYVGKLASPVPAASAIKIYKIAASTTNIPIRGNQFPLFHMGGKAFTTNDDCFHGGCVGSTKNNPLGVVFPRSYIDTYSTSLTTVSAAFAGKDFASNGIVGGESSNPMFILLDNDLHLYGTFYYPDNGPWWGSQSILTKVSAAIIEMGSEGYSLSAVYLDQYNK